MPSLLIQIFIKHIKREFIVAALSLSFFLYYSILAVKYVVV